MGDISTAFVKQFGGNLELLVQQKGSVLRGTVRLEPGIVGEQASFDQLGATAAVKKTTRNSDTPLVKSDHYKRWVTMYDYEWADLIDKEDKVKTLINPDNTYAINAAFALGRSMDDEIIAAALATAKTGKDGTTNTSFDSNFVVAVATSGLTLAKILAAKLKLDKANNDPSEERFWAVDPQQIGNMLNLTQVGSADYNTFKALAQGEVKSFCGFNFVPSNRLAKSSTTRKTLAYTRNALLLAIGRDIKTEIDRLPTKSYATQVYASMGIGATRMNETGIVEVDCLES
jgi:hypothetical protein